MAWIPDEHTEAYVARAPFVRAIGWLSRDHPFATGAVPSAFLDKLRALVAGAVQVEVAYRFGHFMGFHTCDLCPPGPRESGRLGPLGIRNLAVPFANLLCVFPQLIVHYVGVHAYRPPAPFIDAVLDCPLPDRPEFAAQAAPFVHRLRAFRERGRAAEEVRSRNWFEKGLCRVCQLWQYLPSPDADARHCGAALVDRERNPGWQAPHPTRLVITGVAGAGKTTIADRVADRLVLWDFDGDDFHSLANVAKMRGGHALDDADRAPWLDAMHGLLADYATRGRAFVLACSALKAAYRERLAAGIGDLRFVYLRAERDLLAARLAARPAHFFPPSLLDSQLETLEEPGDALIVDAALSIEAIVDQIAADTERPH
jgi:gluconokinase